MIGKHSRVRINLTGKQAETPPTEQPVSRVRFRPRDETPAVPAQQAPPASRVRINLGGRQS